ncbi:hypothetical protein [Algisphaera agarilytica]|uniref:Right handed beta helix region n=1 Tax=Algisphaera agarilytica TaxID=1385975 RepID=A0A7X0LJU7_9BACT|nr:hypothetical protein [Algisphaera agarilytica]MBB6429227.1 hypothetical protein [Algisphaera agarilytica]
MRLKTFQMLFVSAVMLATFPALGQATEGTITIEEPDFVQPMNDKLDAIQEQNKLIIDLLRSLGQIEDEPGVVTPPVVEPGPAVELEPSGPIRIIAAPGEDVVIRGKRIQNDGRPGIDGPQHGIYVGGQPNSVLVEDVEVSGFPYGIAVESRRQSADEPFPDPVPVVTTRRVYAHDNYNAGEGDAHDRRGSGMFGFNIEHWIIEDSFFENNGFKPGVHPANTFSHNLYIVNRVGLLTLNRVLLKDGSSHGINGGAVRFDGVIASGNAVNFGVKENVEPQRDGWSLAVSDRELRGYGNQVVAPAWHWYNSNPLDGKVQTREQDPIEWDLIRRLPPADRWPAARGMLD